MKTPREFWIEEHTEIFETLADCKPDHGAFICVREILEPDAGKEEAVKFNKVEAAAKMDLAEQCFGELSIGGLEYPRGGNTYKLIVEAFKRGYDAKPSRPISSLTAKELLTHPLVSELLAAGDDMRDELTNFWAGSIGECKWLKAIRLFAGEE